MKKKILYSTLIVFGVAAAAAGWAYSSELYELGYSLREKFSGDTADLEDGHGHTCCQHNHAASHAHHHNASSHHHDHDHDHDDGTIHFSDEQLTLAGIQIREAGPGQLQITLSTRGKIILHPDRLAHVLPKASGIVTDVRKNIGDSVQAGEVLAVINSREMCDAKADYLNAKQKERLASALFEREAQLYNKKITSEQDYLNAKSNYEESRINAQQAMHRLHAFGLSSSEIENINDQHRPNLCLYEIRAPIDGSVINRHITQGEFLEETQTVFEIADLNTVWTEIGIYPKDFHKTREGQQVEVVMPYNGNSAQAQLIYLSPIIQEETITGRAIAELQNPDGSWRPGTYVKVNIALENINAPLVVSKDAVQNVEGQDFVFIKTDEGFEMRAVEIGRKDTQNIEILSGMHSGEPYAATQTFILKAEQGKGTVEHEH